MATNLTAKEEKYCQLRAIKGLNQTDSYKGAYICSNMLEASIYSKASILEKKVKIRSRIKQLTDQKNEKLIKKVNYEIADANAELEEIRQLALCKKNALGQPDPDLTNATKAVGLKMRLFGLDSQKQEISGNLEIQKIFISPEEHNETLKHIEDVINDKS